MDPTLTTIGSTSTSSPRTSLLPSAYSENSTRSSSSALRNDKLWYGVAPVIVGAFFLLLGVLMWRSYAPKSMVSFGKRLTRALGFWKRGPDAQEEQERREMREEEKLRDLLLKRARRRLSQKEPGAGMPKV